MLLNKIIKVFPSFLQDTIELFSVLEPLLLKDYFIAKSICSLILTVIETTYVSENIFQKIYQIVQNLFGREDAISENIFSDATAVLASMVQHSSIENIQNVIFLLQTALNLLENKTFVIQSNMCFLLSAIIMNLKDNIIPYSSQICSSIVNILQGGNSEIFAESMQTISSILIYANKNIEQYKESFMNLLSYGFKSQSPEIVFYSSFPLSDIFRVFPDLVISYGIEVFELMLPIIANENYGKKISFRLIYVIANLMKSFPKTDNAIEMKNRYFELLCIFYVNGIEDNFPIFMDAFSVVLSFSKFDDTFLKQNQKRYLKILLDFGKHPYKTSESYLSFFGLFLTICDCYGRSINIIINQKSIRSIFMDAQKSQQIDISSRSQKILQFLKTF